MDGIHDMGGMAGFGPVPVDENESGHEGWEARLQVVALLSGGMSRGGIEAIPPAEYLASGYAERWLICAERRLTSRGAVDQSDLDRWRHALTDDVETAMPRADNAGALPGLRDFVLTTHPMADATSPRFRPGDRVRVARMRPEWHHRCPRYVRGSVGTVERIAGADPLPAPPAHGRDPEAVYTVSFASVDLWGDQSDAGEAPFELMIDLWESYLEAA